jgi:hypothetical protein
MVIEFDFEYSYLSPICSIEDGYSDIFVLRDSYSIDLGSGYKNKLENIWVADGDNYLKILDFIPVELSNRIHKLNQLYQETYDESYPPDSRFVDINTFNTFIEEVKHVSEKLEEIFKNSEHTLICPDISRFNCLNPEAPKMFK